MNLELLTNAKVVDDAIRFVSEKSEENLKYSGDSNEHDKESNERDHGEYKGQLKKIQEEQTREILAATTNQFSKQQRK